MKASKLFSLWTYRAISSAATNAAVQPRIIAPPQNPSRQNPAHAAARVMRNKSVSAVIAPVCYALQHFTSKPVNDAAYWLRGTAYSGSETPRVRSARGGYGFRDADSRADGDHGFELAGHERNGGLSRRLPSSVPVRRAPPETTWSEHRSRRSSRPRRSIILAMPTVGSIA